MHTTLRIPIHSFVDLITNSSSEVFVSASQKSVDTVKELVGNLLALSGCPVQPEELFSFELVNTYRARDYRDVELSKEEYLKELETPDNRFLEKDGSPINSEDGYENEYGGTMSSIRVTALDPNSPKAKEVAKVLSSLDNLFDLEATYNG